MSPSAFLNCSPPSEDVVCGCMMCAYGHVHHSQYAEVKGQLCRASSLLRAFTWVLEIGLRLSALCGKHLYLRIHFAGPLGCVLRQGLSLWILLPCLGCRAAIQGSSCLQFLRAGMAGACYPAWLFMCVEDLPSSPHACAAGTLLTESFHQPQWMLSLVPSYRQGNRGVSEGLESD